MSQHRLMKPEDCVRYFMQHLKCDWAEAVAAYIEAIKSGKLRGAIYEDGSPAVMTDDALEQLRGELLGLNN